MAENLEVYNIAYMGNHVGGECLKLTHTAYHISQIDGGSHDRDAFGGNRGRFQVKAAAEDQEAEEGGCSVLA